MSQSVAAGLIAFAGLMIWLVGGVVERLLDVRDARAERARLNSLHA